MGVPSIVSGHDINALNQTKNYNIFLSIGNIIDIKFLMN